MCSQVQPANQMSSGALQKCVINGTLLILFGDLRRLYITIYGNLTQKWRPGSDNVPLLYEPLEWVIAKIYFFSYILSPSKLSVWVSARSKECFFFKSTCLQAISNYHNFHTSSLYHTLFNDWIPLLGAIPSCTTCRPKK